MQGGACVAPLTTTWEHHLVGSDFIATAVDGAGNVYVAGTLTGSTDLGGGMLTSAGASDILVVSYAANKTHRWSKRFGASGGDQGAAITADEGQVYITGSFSGSVDFGGGSLTSAGSGDAFVLTLSSSSGVFVAARGFGSVDDDAGLAVVVDADRNVTTGGYFGVGTIDFGGTNTLTGAGPFNAFVASAAASGTHRWSRRLSGSGTTTYSTCDTLAVDASGNVTTGGALEGSTDFGVGTVSSAGDRDAFVASYTSSGTLRWSRLFGATQSDSTEGLAADGDGNVVVGGGFQGSVNFGTGAVTGNGTFDGFVLILDGATGVTRFARKLGAATSGTVFEIGVDPAGHAVAVGRIEGAANLGTGALSPLGGPDIFVAGFDKTTGAGRFAKRYGSSQFDAATGLAVTDGGAMAIAGNFADDVNLGTGVITTASGDNSFVLMLAP